MRTAGTLKRLGYRGDWRVVVDDEDPTLPEYLEEFGTERVLIFSKGDYLASTDRMDILPNTRTAVYARNACFDIARSLGATHFLELDDDYQDFQWRWEEEGKLQWHYILSLDSLFATMLDLLEDTGAAAVALAQGGDYVGGVQSRAWAMRYRRKAMNSWFLRVDSPLRFGGRMNDDVCMYTTQSHRGRLFITTMYAMITQAATQVVPGGMSEEYVKLGTYIKSFYSVMSCPSAVKVSVFRGNGSQPRIHHEVRGRNCYPKILDEANRKGVTAHG